MPIPRPVTKTKIATVTWGIPITDAVNQAVDTDIPALKAFDNSIKPTAWTALSLSAGWVTEGVAGYAPAQYRKVGDIVYLRGSIKSGTYGGIATLPAGFLPPTNLRLMFGGMDPTGVPSIHRADLVVPAGTINIYIAPNVLFLTNVSWSTV